MEAEVEGETALKEERVDDIIEAMLVNPTQIQQIPALELLGVKVTVEKKIIFLIWRRRERIIQ